MSDKTRVRESTEIEQKYYFAHDDDGYDLAQLLHYGLDELAKAILEQWDGQDRRVTITVTLTDNYEATKIRNAS